MPERTPSAIRTDTYTPPAPRQLALLFGGMALVLVVLVFGWEDGLRDRVPQWVRKISWGHDRPWNKPQWDAALGQLTLITGAGVLGYAVLRRFAWTQTRRFQRAVIGVLIALLLSSSFIYFYARRAQLPTYGHRWDTYHYLLGPKYYKELDYYGLYDCTVEAMGKKRVKNRVRVRNLRTYALQNAAKARKRANCEQDFGPERWAEFKQDIETYIGFSSAGYIRDMMRDHGYNGAPFHATSAGLIANTFDVSLDAINRVALFDALGLMLMLALITWAFGWKLGLVFAIYFVTNFVDRAGATGASFFRVQWMVALGISMAMLHKQKYGWAAALLVISSMLNVFPVLFSAAILAKMGVQYVRTRKLEPKYRSFLKSAIITSVLCGAVSISYGNGVSNYTHFFENMAHHAEGPPNKDGSRRERIPGYGVGLKFTFLYRGEHSKKTLTYSKRKKSDEFKQVKWIYKTVAYSLVALSLLIAVRLDDLEGSILVGFTAFFCLLGTVGYYFACASLLIVMWQKRAAQPLGSLMIAAFFGCNVLAYMAYKASGSADVAHNTVMSFAWLFYLLLTLVVLGHQSGLFADLSAWLAASPPNDEPDDEPAEHPSDAAVAPAPSPDSAQSSPAPTRDEVQDEVQDVPDSSESTESSDSVR